MTDLHPEDFATVLVMVESPPEPTPQLVDLLKVGEVPVEKDAFEAGAA